MLSGVPGMISVFRKRMNIWFEYLCLELLSSHSRVWREWLIFLLGIMSEGAYSVFQIGFGHILFILGQRVVYIFKMHALIIRMTASRFFFGWALFITGDPILRLRTTQK